MTDIHSQLCEAGPEWITLIHGLGEDHSIFRKQIDFLTESGFSTLAVDLRGHGRSPVSVREGTERISIQSHSLDLDDVLRAAGIARTHLVGFSLGGTVALHFACREQAKVSKLCIINPALYGGRFFTWRVKGVRPFLTALGSLGLVDRVSRRNPADLSEASYTNAYFSFLNGLRTTSIKGLYDNIRCLKEYRLPAELRLGGVPVLVLSASNDELLEPGLADFIHSRLVREGTETSDFRRKTIAGNHVLTLSNPEGLNRELAEFLSRG